MLRRCKIGILILIISIVQSTGHSDEIISEVFVPADEQEIRRLLVVPFPFYNESIGTGAGIAAIAQGYIQPQVLAVGAALASARGTYMSFFMLRNYQVPGWSRIIIDPQISSGKFEDIRSYTINSPEFPDERPGSNDSSERNYLEADGTDFWFDIRIKYLLPIGDGKDAIFPRTVLYNGVVVSDETVSRRWNPLKSGRTYIELTPFYREMDLKDGVRTIQRTAGVEFALTYDNTDFRSNPSAGSYQSVFLSRDWGGFDSSAPWTVAGIDFTTYYSLGESETSRQRVAVFNFWTVNCLTWDSYSLEHGQRVYHRPPTYKGATLGGLWRLRGYPATRFHDRAAVYYALEYRHTLVWNPLQQFTLQGRLDTDWIQLLGFMELGRVAPEWKIKTLHKNMKWSYGAGLRLMINNIIVRADLGVSSEDAIVQLFIGHPF